MKTLVLFLNIIHILFNQVILISAIVIMDDKLIVLIKNALFCSLHKILLYIVQYY